MPAVHPALLAGLLVLLPACGAPEAAPVPNRGELAVARAIQPAAMPLQAIQPRPESPSMNPTAAPVAVQTETATFALG